MKAVVMAGGFGTRIQPLTSSVPKPMIPVCNRPMMEYIVRSLKQAGIVDIVMLLYFKPEVIQNHFGNGSAFGVNISYIIPDDDYGTAGAVKKAEHILNERFIVISGDLITDFNIPEIIGYHEVKNAKASITLTSVPDPLQFGVVITDKDGKIVRFLEKPGWGEVFSDTINTGIYVFEPEILGYIPANRNFDFSKDLFPTLMSNGIDIFGYNAKGYWRDVGNPDSYREALIEIMEGKVQLPFEGKKHTFEHGIAWIAENATVSEKADIRGMVIIGEGCVVKDNAILTNCVLGANATVSKKAEVTNSILWAHVGVGEGSKISSSVLCNGVKLGKKVTADAGCIIAENTEVGNYVVFEKDVMVWPDKQIEDGSIVSSNLIWGDKWKKSIFEGGKVSARTNVELSAEMAAKLGAAFGSQLPRGSRVLLARDYHRASRMLKRSFLGGLLSTGVNAVDLRMEPLPVMRYKLTTFGEVGGVHFRQSPQDPTHTEILFFDESGAQVDANFEKNVERIFFRENFRRVTVAEIGEIYDRPMVKEFYEEGVLACLDLPLLRSKQRKLVIDLQNGTTGQIVPKLLKAIEADAVILNAHQEETKLSRTMHQVTKSLEEVSTIVKVLEADAGCLMLPHGEKVRLVADDGTIIPDDTALLLMLMLIDRTVSDKVRVYLPAYSPTVLDSVLTNVDIVRGKFSGLKPSVIRDYYFMGDMEAAFLFTEHSTHPDSVFSTLKLLEMLARVNTSISEMLKKIPSYAFNHTVINCPLEQKGFLMRKMSEEAMDKNASFLDGIKISISGAGWVHMVPDQYTANVHLYVEAPTHAQMKALHEEYVQKINGWISGE